MRPKLGTKLVRAFALVVAMTSNPEGVSAAVIERVVAVVGDKAILFSDLSERARPMLLRVHQEVPAGAQRAAAISQLHKVLLESIIDEELEQRAANSSKIVVTAREVDDALGRIAVQNKLSVEQIIEEATRAGLTERQYRHEIRRQVLEAKLLNLRLQGRIRVTEEDLRASYRHVVLDERKKLRFRVAWITLNAPRTSSVKALDERRQLADRIADQARRSADFSALARQYSDDTRTREAGGLLAEMRPGQLPAVLDRAVLALDVGQVSAPLRTGDELTIVKVVERQESELPSYEDAHRELSERVYLEKMNKARRHWLDGLRRRTHVEVRL